MTRVRVDFNSRGADGTVRGSQRRADGELEVGLEVELYDPEEPDMTFQATVVDYDPATGLARFEVSWASAEAARPEPLGARFFKATSWGVPAIEPLPVTAPPWTAVPIGARFA
ncbi:MAG: hypothetical protein ACR2K2_01160 [Mycobacteriales bacterium]